MDPAAAHGDLDEVRRLYALGEPFGRAAHLAAINGHLETLMWIRTNGGGWTTYAANWSARNGHLETLRWIRANGGEWTNCAADWAAENGLLETLKWIRANAGEWTSDAADGAAKNGHLETLKWIRANGGEWTHYAADWAAVGGHLETLEWLVRADAPLSDNKTHRRTKVEREQRVFGEALDRHLIGDLTNVVMEFVRGVTRRR
jgi:hypothetical protein